MATMRGARLVFSIGRRIYLLCGEYLRFGPCYPFLNTSRRAINKDHPRAWVIAHDSSTTIHRIPGHKFS
ncbi:hypothetical protein ETAA8_61340 [Anatilimnocola aggregata]|uniref:Uncharacterized protein n=1 Tax=Anatilimnocola aggregata TaxID=2528021 RepID=A0A517YL75_9BACT|nr:hypothetical protein ETAA8_61340 [Anatilimnocola aggregata]